jgi:D-serine deaminase-like pyridoxal phosphate-dependent protein
MRVEEIDTPAMVVDLDVMDANLKRVADYACAHGLRLRPHTKTHKSVALAKRQLALGAAGLTVAKVSEAEVMMGASPHDVLVAFPVIGRPKLERLVEIVRRTHITVALDSLFVAEQLSQAASAAQVTFGVLAEMDAGLGRVGVAPGEPLLDLARSIAKLPGIEFEGITFYPGHIKDLDEPGRRALAQLGELLRSVLDEFAKAGMEVHIVSGGSTPTLFHSHEIEGLTEIRPGTYVFNDLNTVRSGGCKLEECAARVLATVVSTARPGQMIIDGGSKTFSSDRPVTAGDVTFGQLVEAPGARFHKMNEEHGFIDVTHAERGFSVGDRVQVIPNHVCVAMNLHERVYGVRRGAVEEVWTVDGRGKLQ